MPSDWRRSSAHDESISSLIRFICLSTKIINIVTLILKHNAMACTKKKKMANGGKVSEKKKPQLKCGGKVKKKK